jgi:hypothetical protein
MQELLEEDDTNGCNLVYCRIKFVTRERYLWAEIRPLVDSQAEEVQTDRRWCGLYIQVLCGSYIALTHTLPPLLYVGTARARTKGREGRGGKTDTCIYMTDDD